MLTGHRFGGTNGTHWFNDVWSYDPAIGAWSQLECIGYIPAPREGHSAALVNDVMYIFGGRTEEGADLGDLAAFRLTSRRWYTFQNMGPSPSPRSGHSMTAFGNQIIVLAGEPSIALPDVEELSLVYILDTSKIRYPNDQQSQQVSSAERVHGNGRPSIERSAASQVRGTQRDVLAGPGEELEKKSTGSHEAAPLEAKKSDFAARYGGHPQDMSTGSGASGPVPGSRLPRVSIAQSPSGPSPQQQALPPRFNGAMHRSRAVPKDNRISEAATDVNRATSTNREHVVPIQLSIPGDGPKQAPLVRAPGPDIRSQLTPNLQSIQTPRSLTVNSGFENVQRLNEDLQQNSREHPKQQFLNEKPEVSGPNMQHPQNFSDQRKDADRSNGKEVPIIQNSLPVQHATLGNSRQEALMKDFEAEKTRCSWYASELALARKAGYQQILSKSPILQEAAELFFGEEEMPLIEALVAIRARLAEVQMSVDSRVSAAALEVTEIEQQRDVAVREAAYAKAKLAAHLDVQVRPTSTEPTSRGTSDESRRKEISRKLAAALLTQTELQSTISLMTAELQAERLAREVAEGSAEAAQKFAAEINQLWNPGEVESLRIELHNLGKAVRDEAVQKPKAHATQQQLVLEKDALAQRLGDTLEVNRQHSKLFISFREAVGVSDSKALLLERKLEEERMKREAVDQKLLTLTAVHEERMTELETMGSKLQTAEDLAETHATEARTYREVVLAGLDKMKSGDLSEQAIELTDERVSILRQQVEDAHAAAKQMQENGNDALEKLRNAEQRIAGLEAYQIQSSREKLSLQKQLQDEVRVKRSFQNKYDTAQQQLTSQQRDANALSVQHDALKELLVERGIGEFGVSKYTSFSTSDGHRLREPEQKFSMNIKDLEEMKASFEMREQEADRAFREKLEQLEQDYQSAVHYVKGTEKMLNRMKEELAKSKAQNKRLQEELHRSRSMESDAAAEWEKERHSLRQEIGEIQESVKESVYQLERQMKEVHAELYTTQESRDHLRHLNEQAQKELVQASQRPSAELDQLKSENIMLQSRAMDAEKKVTLLLDQVNTSIGNYRRRSQQKHGSGLHLPNLLPSTTPQETDFGKRSFVMHQSFARNASENIETANIRNSTALESLASELESLRTHWEGTNRDHNFELDRSPITPETVGGGDIGHSLTSWRKRLDNDDGGQRSNDEETEHDFIMSSPSGKRKSISAVHGFIAIGAEGDGDAETAEKIFDEREGTDSHQLVKPRSLTAGGGKGVAQPAVTS